jgi:hypothetical protein
MLEVLDNSLRYDAIRISEIIALRGKNIQKLDKDEDRLRSAMTAEFDIPAISQTTGEGGGGGRKRCDSYEVMETRLRDTFR